METLPRLSPAAAKRVAVIAERQGKPGMMLRLAVDGGGGYRLSGADAGWFVTAGGAVSLGLPWSPRR